MASTALPVRNGAEFFHRIFADDGLKLVIVEYAPPRVGPGVAIGAASLIKVRRSSGKRR
jgi:hypothetical protein